MALTIAVPAATAAPLARKQSQISHEKVEISAMKARSSASKTKVKMMTAKKPNRGLFHRALTSAPKLNFFKLRNHAPKRYVPSSPVALNACVVYSDDWGNEAAYGMYSVPQAEGQAFEMIQADVHANRGGAEIDGLYYAMEYLDYGFFTFASVTTYDTETWESIDMVDTEIGMMATDMAADPVTGYAYGCFYNDEGDGFVFGYADFSTMTRTAICETDMLSGVAVDNDGTVYALDNDGNLYKIDKDTGEKMLIGNTGVVNTYLTSAAIDPKSGTLYYATSTDAGGSLYTIDKSTAEAALVVDFPGGEEIAGMYVAKPLAEDNAPAAPTGVSADFVDGSLSGKINFKTPLTLFNGGAAQGALTYSIKVAGEEIASGDTEFGADVAADVTVDAPGEYEFVVTVSNGAGESPKAKVKLFVGADCPESPFVNAAFADGKITVTWDPVTESVNGGYIDVDNITYTVKRFPGAVEIATDIAATSVVDEIEIADGLVIYTYSVSAKSGEMVSDRGLSNNVVVGSITPPYSESFDSADGFSTFTVLDKNLDNRTWTYNPEKSAACYIYSGVNEGDDWLITAPLKLESGKQYTLSFNTFSNSYAERIEVAIGQSPTAEEMTEILIPATEVSDKVTADSPMNLKAVITPEADGLYYIGFHAISDPDCFYLFVDDVVISAGLGTSTPAAVSDLKVVPAAGGAMAAAISFKAPDKNIAGEAIESVEKIELSRDGEVIKTFDNPAPGAELSFDDNEVPESGYHRYSVVAYNQDGAGAEAEVTVYIGVNFAAPIEAVNAVTTDNEGEVTLSWTPVTTDIDGNPLDPSQVTYDIYVFSGYSRTLVESGVSECQYTYQVFPAGSEQDFMQWLVFPMTEAGEYEGQLSPMIAVGKPYDCPFSESFANQEPASIWALNSAGGCEIGLGDSSLGVDPQDNDGGYITFRSQALDAYGEFQSGNILVSGNVPALVFYTFVMEEDLNEIAVYINDGSEKVLAKTVVVGELGEPDQWGRVIVPLDAYIGKKISLTFVATVKSHAYTLLDNIYVGDIAANDLSASRISAPAKVNVGDDYNVVVDIENLGTATAESYSVDLFRNGEKVASKDGSALAGGTSTSVSFPQSVSIADAAENEFHAVVNFAADENPDNNTSEIVTVTVKQSSYPAVQNLAAEQTEGGISITWHEPDLSSLTAAEITEDFEAAGSFAKEFGDWTFVDADDSAVGGFQDLDIPGIEIGADKVAFFLFDASQPQFNQSFAAFSGDKYLASLFRYDDGAVDDWAISPKLSGDAQTISFMARSYSGDYPEAIEVLYSVGGKDISEFVSVKTLNPVSDSWTEISADLPAGATYFAIRSTASSSFMLMIDDVTFTPAPVELSLRGYNVYRDGVKINEAVVEDTGFVDAEVTEGEHVYHVTAVYDKGESAPAAVSVSMSGLTDIAAGAVSINVIDGSIVIDGADGKPVAVYAVDGKTIFSSVGEVKTVVPVSSGIYVVMAAETVKKVIAK